MKNLKIPFETRDIPGSIKSIKGLLNVINYLESILKIYNKVYDFETDEDVENFMKLYGFENSVIHDDKSIYYYYLKSSEMNEKLSRVKYKYIKYEIFVLRIIRLIVHSELFLKKYKNTYELLKDDSLLIFDKNEFIKKTNSFNNCYDSVDWIAKYFKAMNSILNSNDEVVFAELYNKNRDLVKYYRNVVYDNSYYGKFYELRNHIRNNILPLAVKYFHNHILLMHIEYSKGNYPDNFFSFLDKYPSFYFNYDLIIKYSNKLFNEPQEKGEYYVYLIKHFKSLMEHKCQIPFSALTSIPLLVNDLKSIYGKIKSNSKSKKANILYNLSNDSRLSSDIDRILSEYKNRKTIVSIIKDYKGRYARNFDKNVVKTEQKDLKSSVNDNIVVKKKSLSLHIKNNSIIKNSSKLRWLGSKNQLITFLTLLQEQDFLTDILEEDFEYKQYLSIFVDRNYLNYSEFDAKKVVWRSELSELAYIIGSFTASRTKSLIHDTDKWKKTSNVFLSKDLTNISPASLRSIYNRKTVTANHQLLNEIIESVKNAK